MASPGPNEPRRGWSLQSFTVDEIINLLEFKLHTRGGRRFLVASCFVLALIVALVPILRRSSGHPADALSNRPTAPITLPSTTSTVPLATGTLLVPVGGGGLNRFGPPLTTAPAPTTAPRVTAPPQTAPQTAPPQTAPPQTAPPQTAPPVTAPPPPPVTLPPTTTPDTGVVVPVG